MAVATAAVMSSTQQATDRSAPVTVSISGPEDPLVHAETTGVAPTDEVGVSPFSIVDPGSQRSSHSRTRPLARSHRR